MLPIQFVCHDVNRERYKMQADKEETQPTVPSGVFVVVVVDILNTLYIIQNDARGKA